MLHYRDDIRRTSNFNSHWAHSLGKDVSYKRFDDSDLDEKGVPKRKLSLMWNQRSVDVFFVNNI